MQAVKLLQQYLPFTVLKLMALASLRFLSILLQQYLPFTVLKHSLIVRPVAKDKSVATVLTVYGIETAERFTKVGISMLKLQQYLPFTVLKPLSFHLISLKSLLVATVLTVYGIETSE